MCITKVVFFSLMGSKITKNGARRERGRIKGREEREIKSENERMRERRGREKRERERTALLQKKTNSKKKEAPKKDLTHSKKRKTYYKKNALQKIFDRLQKKI